MIGFTQNPTIEELVALSRERKIPLMVDAGSGYLFLNSDLPLKNEPVIEELLKKGADVVCFSGDKLLGGSQAGIVLGKREIIQQIRHNPLMRVLRLDKFILFTLSETLKIYFYKNYMEKLPLFRMMKVDDSEVKKRCLKIRRRLVREYPQLASVLMIEQTESMIGGGSTPGQMIPSYALVVEPQKGKLTRVEKYFRQRHLPIIGRITEDRCFFDLRTVFDFEDTEIIAALKECVENSLLP